MFLMQNVNENKLEWLVEQANKVRNAVNGVLDPFNRTHMENGIITKPIDTINSNSLNTYNRVINNANNVKYHTDSFLNALNEMNNYHKTKLIYVNDAGTTTATQVFPPQTQSIINNLPRPTVGDLSTVTAFRFDTFDLNQFIREMALIVLVVSVLAIIYIIVVKHVRNKKGLSEYSKRSH